MGLEELSQPSSPDEHTVDIRSPVDSILPSQPHHRHHWDICEVKERFKRRKSSAISQRRPSLVLHRSPTGSRQFWKFKLRPWHDDEEQDWWFASTAVPLLAATFGPLANVLSIAALVTSWRMCLVPGVDKADAAICVFEDGKGNLVPDLEGTPFTDPRWCYYLNVVSLILGFVGNFFLLCNFTQRIRYIIALPVTIVMWYIATGILIGITVSMELYVPPVRPNQTYSQGFWYAVM
jgi:potassium channel subfamily K, other eukaryote